MRIAFDVSYIQKRRTGIGRYSTGLLESLLSLDHQNEYILHGWSSGIDRDWIVARQRANVRLDIRRIPGAVKRLYWNRLRTFSIERIIGEFDIFQSGDPLVPPVGDRASIATMHDIAYLRYPHFFEKEVLARDRAIRENARSATAIIVPSEFSRSEILSEYRISPDRVTCVRPPVDPVFSPVRTGSDERIGSKYAIHAPFLLHTGTIEPRKNIINLVRAFELLIDETERPHHLLLVGRKGWKFEATIAAIRASRHRQRIHLIDFVPDDDLAALYRNADLFVYPSLYEGHGSPVVEAMASGTAVVTSKTSALQEVAESAALLVDPTNPQSICEGIDSLLADAGLRKSLVDRGSRRAKRFSSGEAGHALLQLYTSIIVR
jgi:glycosyltransferase involved in cell wall biosynthesis